MVASKNDKPVTKRSCLKKSLTRKQKKVTWKLVEKVVLDVNLDVFSKNYELISLCSLNLVVLHE
jgi:hypothetical protein